MIKRANDDLSFLQEMAAGPQEKTKLYHFTFNLAVNFDTEQFPFFCICYHIYLLNQYQLLNGMSQGLHMSTVLVYTDFNICYLQNIMCFMFIWGSFNSIFLKIK